MARLSFLEWYEAGAADAVFCDFVLSCTKGLMGLSGDVWGGSGGVVVEGVETEHVRVGREGRTRGVGHVRLEVGG